MNKLYLAHYGIKGQRWGIRRFQNEDGTLTALGKERYGTSEELEKEYRRANISATKNILEGTSKTFDTAGNAISGIGKNKSKTVKTKSYEDMSDDELRKRISRLSMEKTYGELTGDTVKIRSGADWAREILQTAGAVAAIGATVAVTILNIRQIALQKPANT